ncbi:tautomerase family protein [Mycobacterium sp. ML4]
MPLWTIHHSPGIFTDAEKHELASRITDHYERAGLPRFYVITLFTETSPENFYVGGEPTSAGIRIVIDHIARHSQSTEHRQRITRWINDIVAPLFAGKPDLHWEFHVDETSEELWMINGYVPPPGGSEAEKDWARKNVVSAY